MRRSLTVTATAALLAVPMLAGCSGSSSNKTAVSNAASSTATQSNTTSNDAPAGSSGTSNAGAKPNKDDVKAGLVKFYASKGVTGAPATLLANCMVDKGYDVFSAQTLNAMKDGEPTKIDQKDSANFVKVSGQCAGASGDLPTG
ncbi:hypothetical protein [Calidifontibacter terrae]